MNVQEMDIYVDGQPVKSLFCESNGNMLVPALFFKNVNVIVDYEREQQCITLKQNKTTINFYKNINKVLIEEENQKSEETLAVAPVEIGSKIFIPFENAVQKLGMSYTKCTSSDRIDLMTNHSVATHQAVYYQGPAKKRRAALTFDDGPDHVYTPKILDILKGKKVQATFFLVGQQMVHAPEIIKRMVKEGHEIGNHSWGHPSFKELTGSELTEEINSTEAIIRSYTGKFSSILRPPYGFVTSSDIQIIHKLGYEIIMWSVDTLDWSGKSDEEILSIVNRDLTNGAIILQHTFYSSTNRLDGTVKALPVIIDKLINEGYEIVTISELLELTPERK